MLEAPQLFSLDDPAFALVEYAAAFEGRSLDDPAFVVEQGAVADEPVAFAVQPSTSPAADFSPFSAFSRTPISVL